MKIYQLVDICKDGYSRVHSVKKIIERIYKKSREYLDIIINNWKISLKYHSLMLSVYIMKKSVEEVLIEEKSFSEKDNKKKEDFIKKNDLYFQEIMYDYYKINYESSDQYKELINDEEINKIFKYNEIRNLSPALACLKSQEIQTNKKKEKKNEENNNQISTKYSTYTHDSNAAKYYKRKSDITENRNNNRYEENKKKEIEIDKN